MSLIQSPPELIVMAKPQADLRSSPAGGVRGAASAKPASLAKLLKSAKCTLEPLFGDSEERVRAAMGPALRGAAPDSADPATFYTLRGDVKNTKAMLENLLSEPSIDGAYLKPGGEPPVYRGPVDGAEMAPAGDLDAPPAPTPDYVPRQLYLEAAPGGVDARFAWTKPGGRGDGLRVIDLEWGWNFSHEDLLVNSGGLLDGSNHSNTHHGTAVLGEIGGDHNTRGVSGISPNARLSAISFVGNPSATAIRKAADRLVAGDIMLLEIHRAGPRHGFAGREDQLGYIAIEWWPDDFAAILYATSRGILVVEAAGNGAENLDDALYSVRPAGFPASWRNPFNRSNPQCGAILVGAGAPPPGTHGRNHGADRSRLDFSNYGSAVDCQGWGREVTTTGYGTLFNDSVNQQYTDTFSGTSSASPIVVGVLACVQGWLRAAGKPLRTPAQARSLLRTHGSPQQDTPGRPATQRIGRRPDLRLLHGALFPKVVVKEVKDVEKLPKEGDKNIKEFVKEMKEIKEVEKNPKEFIKDTKEAKEVEKNPKEFVKEFKEKDKDVIEHGGFGGIGGIGGVGGFRPPGAMPGDTAGEADVQARLAALEAAVVAMSQSAQFAALGGGHFIPGALRPDVGGAADDAAAEGGDDGSA
jgi:hypothetical protein